MSKNFEKEYIELTQVEVPDLWDRIEAGLTPKSAQNPEKSEASIIDFKKEAVSVKETVSISKIKETNGLNDFNQESGKKKAQLLFIKKYKAVLAAAVCVMVILPAAVVMGRMGIGLGGAKESMTEDTAAAETMEYAVTTEAAAEEAEIAVAPESTAEESGMTEASMAEETLEEPAESEAEMPAEAAADAGMGDKSEAVEEYAAEERLDEAPAENEAMKDTMAETEAAEKELQKSQSTMEGAATEAAEEERAVVSSLDVEDGTVLTHVKIRVYAKEEVSEEGEAKGLGNLYRAEVLEDAEGLLEAGQEILIYISPLSSTYWTAEEETYEVMLEYDSQREYPFHLKACY